MVGQGLPSSEKGIFSLKTQIIWPNKAIFLKKGTFSTKFGRAASDIRTHFLPRIGHACGNICDLLISKIHRANACSLLFRKNDSYHGRFLIITGSLNAVSFIC